MNTPSLLRDHDFPACILGVLSTLSQAGHENFIVGGAIRDILIGRHVIDYDIATSAKPFQLSVLFGDVNVALGDYGNTTLSINGAPIELTTFRQELGFSNHRHPDNVIFVSRYEEDWPRRDFTINALAYNPLTQTLLDPAKGLDDIEDRLIRSIGPAEIRFEEDTLRMLRAIRLAAECCFYIESSTFMAINEAIFLKATLSPEQIDHEINKIFKSALPDLGLVYLKKAHILDTIYPQIQDFSENQLKALRDINLWRERRKLLLNKNPKS